MKETTFTHIHEKVRADFNITRDEYALCNYIKFWSSYRTNPTPGWCGRNQKDISAFIGITDRGLRKMLLRLHEKNLLDYNDVLKMYCASEKWDEAMTEAVKPKEQSSDEAKKPKEQSSAQQEQSSAESEQSSFESEDEANKVPPHIKESNSSISNNSNSSSTPASPNGEPSPPASEFQLPRNPSQLETSLSKPKQEEQKQPKEARVSTPSKNARFVLFSESLASPTAATEFKEFLQTYAGGIYKHADAVFYVAKALQWVSNTPAGAKAKYADWRVALAGWCRTDGVKAAPQAQHQQPTPAEIGTAKRNAHLEELQKRGFRRPTPQQ